LEISKIEFSLNSSLGDSRNVSETQLVLDRSNIILDGYGKLTTPPDLKIVRQLASRAPVWLNESAQAVLLRETPFDFRFEFQTRYVENLTPSIAGNASPRSYALSGLL
jgi:hypothetical protein